MSDSPRQQCWAPKATLHGSCLLQLRRRAASLPPIPDTLLQLQPKPAGKPPKLPRQTVGRSREGGRFKWKRNQHTPPRPLSKVAPITTPTPDTLTLQKLKPLVRLPLTPRLLLSAQGRGWERASLPGMGTPGGAWAKPLQREPRVVNQLPHLLLQKRTKFQRSFLVILVIKFSQKFTTALNKNLM